jgi:arylsulfatase A-like enzyme
LLPAQWKSRVAGPTTRLIVVLVVLGCIAAALFHSAALRSPQRGTLWRNEPIRNVTIERDRRMLFDAPAARVPMTVPEQARLRLGFGIGAASWRQLKAIDFVVAFDSQRGRVELFRRRLTREIAGAWEQVDIPLVAFAGQDGQLQLETEIVEGRLGWKNLIFWAPPALRPSPRDERPNIVLFSIDTLRADHLGCYGYKRDTSPTLDRLAGEGVRFRQAIAPSSWTLPSHATMLTGVNPVRHSAVSFTARTPLPPQVDTVAELLWRSGYATAGFTDGGFLAPRYGFDRGFELYASTVSPLKDFLAENVERALDWVRSTDGQPFFLFLHTYAVHMPFAPPPPYDRLFDPEYDGPCREKILHASVNECLGRDDADPRVVRHVKALYDGEIRRTDAIFGRFLGVLRAMGLAERTCVIVTSDHGEEFKEHGRFFHRRASLYEELLRVPLIVWCPERFSGGRVVDQQVGVVDIAPTILDITGVPIPDGLDGVSLLPTLRGRSAPQRTTLVSEVDASIEKERRDAFTVVAVRTDRHKLLVSSGAAPALELFDLRDDPGETRDVSGTLPEVVAQLGRALSGSSLSRRTASAPPLPVSATPDPASRERLRLLGYGD